MFLRGVLEGFSYAVVYSCHADTRTFLLIFTNQWLFFPLARKIVCTSSNYTSNAQPPKTPARTLHHPSCLRDYNLELSSSTKIPTRVFCYQFHNLNTAAAHKALRAAFCLPSEYCVRVLQRCSEVMPVPRTKCQVLLANRINTLIEKMKT